MQVIQKSGGRSIRIEGDKVIVDGKELLPDEANKVREEGLAKLKQKMRTTRNSPQKGDSVVVVSTTDVQVFGTRVTVRRK